MKMWYGMGGLSRKQYFLFKIVVPDLHLRIIVIDLAIHNLISPPQVTSLYQHYLRSSSRDKSFTSSYQAEILAVQIKLVVYGPYQVLKSSIERHISESLLGALY